MMNMQDINIRPAINIYYDGQMNKRDFEAILHGIEEEGIPYELKPGEPKDILKLSHEASLASKLGVGVGISGNEAVLHFEKLDELSPLFRMSIKDGKAALRALGANAARLVKRMPFKEIRN